MLSANNISKYFDDFGEKITILDSLNLDVKEGEKIAIVGPSGSGKSTLLSILAGFDNPNTGEVTILGKNIHKMTENEAADFRNRTIGFVFQSFELIPAFSALENVMTPLEIGNKENAIKDASNLLKSVRVDNRANNLPQGLSGGEQQRVAIARAISNHPKLIFADEPTGNLDRITGLQIIDLLLSDAKIENTSLIVVTHDENVASKMDKIYKLESGKLVLA